MYTFSSENGTFLSFANLSAGTNGGSGNDFDGAESKGAVRRVASFHLPPVHTDVHIGDTTISGYPTSSSPKNLNVPLVTSPFILASDAHLYVLDIWYQGGQSCSNHVRFMSSRPVFQCRLAIHAHGLVERLQSKGLHTITGRDTHRSPDPDRRRTTTESDLDVVEFPWNEWGPNSTRLFHDRIDDIHVEGSSSDVTLSNPR